MVYSEPHLRIHLKLKCWLTARQMRRDHILVRRQRCVPEPAATHAAAGWRVCSVPERGDRSREPEVRSPRLLLGVVGEHNQRLTNSSTAANKGSIGLSLS